MEQKIFTQRVKKNSTSLVGSFMMVLEPLSEAG